MNLPIETWQSLLEKEEERGQISIEDIKQEAYEFIDDLCGRLDKELVVIAVDAQRQAEANKSAREEAGPDEQGRVGTRVRLINNSLVAEWYRNRFAKPEPNGGR